MLCNEIKICKRAASMHARDGEREREGGRQGGRETLLPVEEGCNVLSLSLAVRCCCLSCVADRGIKWAHVRSPHYDCMFDERLTISFPLSSLSEEDIKRKSPRSKGRKPNE